MTVIAADIGGSKTWVGWFANADHCADSQYFDNRHFLEAGAILAQFLATHPHLAPARTHLVLAVAGPVQDGIRCNLTNLPWIVDGAELQRRFGFASVRLMNDLVATALAMAQPTLSPHLQSLNGASADFHQPVTVISVGTGLGQALLLPEGNGHRALPSEGGHTSLAPFDQHSAALVAAAYAEGCTHLGWEEWFSGSGLPRLHQAMFPAEAPLSSSDITHQARTAPNSTAARCVEFFVQGLFAEAGNLALQYQSAGGVILAGGVVQYVVHWLRQPALQAHMYQKSRHGDWLHRLPLVFCSRTDAALLGAAAEVWRQIRTGDAHPAPVCGNGRAKPLPSV